MTTDEAKRLAPGNRVFDWIMADSGTVIAIDHRSIPDEEIDLIKVTVRLDHGAHMEYSGSTDYDNQLEYLDRE